MHIFYNVLFLFAGQFGSLMLNVPLIAYHVHRYVLEYSNYLSGRSTRVDVVIVTVFVRSCDSALLNKSMVT